MDSQRWDTECIVGVWRVDGDEDEDGCQVRALYILYIE